MRRIIIFRLLLLLIFLSCNGRVADGDGVSAEEREESESVENYPDGTYCAEVEYSNPNTGTQSSYTLTVEVAKNEITQINFPQGWLDNDNFNTELDENGNASFTSDSGYDYEVHITGGEDGCFESVPAAKQCIGITKDSKRCRHLTDNANGLCWQHQNQENGNYRNSTEENENGDSDNENEEQKE